MEVALQAIPIFVLVVFRIAGMMLYAPLFGSAKVPRRVRVMLALVLAVGMFASVTPPPHLPQTTWEAAVGIGGELAFGLAMGMVMSFVFIAVQWAGEMIGQQMGLNLGAVFDPEYGQQGSIIGDLYFMLTLAVFLIAGGHRAMLQAVRASFQILPLLSVGMNASLLDLLVGLLQSATIFAIKLAAPMLVTMLAVDLILGLVGKTVPQMNVMSIGLNLRSVLGMLVVIVGLSLSVRVIRDSVLDSMESVWNGYTSSAPAAPAAQTGRSCR